MFVSFLALAAIGEKEWFFYVPRDRKYRNGDRPNRVTTSGYWKATGADRMIRNENLKSIGLKKTLVFYSGKAPKGIRSSWIMNEYRLPQHETEKLQKVNKFIELEIENQQKKDMTSEEMILGHFFSHYIMFVYTSIALILPNNKGELEDWFNSHGCNLNLYFTWCPKKLWKGLLTFLLLLQHIY